MLRVARTVRQAYLEGCAPFQDEYVHTWAFVYDFLVDYFRLLRRWAMRSAAEVASWTDLDPAGKREGALRLFAAKRPSVPRQAEHTDRTAVPGPNLPAALPGLWGQWRQHVLSKHLPIQEQRTDDEEPTTP